MAIVFFIVPFLSKIVGKGGKTIAISKIIRIFAAEIKDIKIMFGLMTWLAAVGFAYAGERQRRFSSPNTGDKYKKDIDPITGDYTSTYDGLRRDKGGLVKWRD